MWLWVSQPRVQPGKAEVYTAIYVSTGGTCDITAHQPRSEGECLAKIPHIIRPFSQVLAFADVYFNYCILRLGIEGQE
jgi:hypothetical protein